jgi:glycosyltransferase involved in cell wall biosynthesis
MSLPWLSVVMPVYNGERYLDEALGSIAAQHDPGLEIVALDDGSSDRSLEILKRWESRLPLRIERGERCGNWVEVSNRGLRLARGRFACFLHQDDRWHPDRLRILREALAVPGCNFVVHATEYLDERSRRLGFYHPPYRERAGFLPAAHFVRPLLIQSLLSCPSTIFDRQSALDLGGMDPTLWYSADWDLWIRLCAQGRTRYVARALAAYRLHPQTQSSLRSRDLAEFRRQHEIVFERHFPAWRKRLPDADAVAALAAFSTSLNTSLAALAHRQAAGLLPLAWSFLKLGPFNALRFLGLARLHERIPARVRERLRAPTASPP